jgi:CIC family chloride channel protein
MFACVVSTAVGELVSKGGLYEHLMRWNDIHLGGPGSSNNLRTMKAKDVMHGMVEAYDSKSLLKDVLPSFGASSQRGFPVVERGNLVGVVTQTDLTKLSETESFDSTTVADIMTPHPVAVDPYDSLEEILFLFSRHKFTWLPVAHHDKLKGIILQSDVLNALFTQEQIPVTSPSSAAEESGAVKIE